MFFFRAQQKFIFAQGCIFLLLLSAQAALAQSTSQPLKPGETSAPKAGQSKPGTVGQKDTNSSEPVQSVGPDGQASESANPANANQPQPPPVIFESHGLEYESVTKNGITVMFAELPSRLKEFSIAQVTVTNGSLVSWTVRPLDFTFVRQDGTVLQAVPADYVVAELMQNGNRDDVIKLQLLYENSIYGLANFRSTNGYEKRREAATAQFVNRGFKAAAEASAIALVPVKLKAGDSTDGAIFFLNHTKEKVKNLGAGRLVAHTCGETFMFETYAELKKR
ncbi:MAG TPA: hypothetical protein VKX25_03385 [Bryobacteraceae bacterium]|jgi:hypothetical protein|nr:hypothetical protein [Bryobacteraceae bacterium]